jgi:hypothetical protein
VLFTLRHFGGRVLSGGCLPVNIIEKGVVFRELVMLTGYAVLESRDRFIRSGDDRGIRRGNPRAR